MGLTILNTLKHNNNENDNKQQYEDFLSNWRL